MDDTSNRSIFFLTLSFISIWLIMDNMWGKGYIDNFLHSIFPFYTEGGSSGGGGGDMYITGSYGDTTVDHNAHIQAYEEQKNKDETVDHNAHVKAYEEQKKNNETKYMKLEYNMGLTGGGFE